MSRAGRRAPFLVVLTMAGACSLTGLGSAASPASPTPMNRECAGVTKCVSVPGPWVVVPDHGEADYLLSCPQQGSFAGGVDALATSRDVRVTFQGLMGSPVASGRTTGSAILFEAVSATHTQNAFRPYIGCIPVTSHSSQTVSFSSRPDALRTILAAPKARSPVITPAGPPLTFVAKSIALHPGSTQNATLGCAKGQRLVDGWDATAFATDIPPDLALADKIHVQLEPGAKTVSVSISTSATLPASARAQVQLGVRCTQA